MEQEVAMTFGQGYLDSCWAVRLLVPRLTLCWKWPFACAFWEYPKWPRAMSWSGRATCREVMVGCGHNRSQLSFKFLSDSPVWPANKVNGTRQLMEHSYQLNSVFAPCRSGQSRHCGCNWINCPSWTVVMSFLNGFGALRSLGSASRKGYCTASMMPGFSC